ncbi:hypothetical protein SFUMM280S_00239 [Streptomyces fumanus]
MTRAGPAARPAPHPHGSRHAHRAPRPHALVPRDHPAEGEVLLRRLARLSPGRLRLRPDHPGPDRDRRRLRADGGGVREPGLRCLRHPLARRGRARRPRRPVRPPQRHGGQHPAVLHRHLRLRLRLGLHQPVRRPAAHRHRHGRRVQRQRHLRPGELARPAAQPRLRLPHLRVLPRRCARRRGVRAGGARPRLALAVLHRPVPRGRRPLGAPGAARGRRLAGPGGRRRRAAQPVPAAVRRPPPGGRQLPADGRGHGGAVRGVHPARRGSGAAAVRTGGGQSGGVRGAVGRAAAVAAAARALRHRLLRLPLQLAGPGPAAHLPQDRAGLHARAGQRRPVLGRVRHHGGLRRRRDPRRPVRHRAGPTAAPCWPASPSCSRSSRSATAWSASACCCSR